MPTGDRLIPAHLVLCVLPVVLISGVVRITWMSLSVGVPSIPLIPGIVRIAWMLGLVVVRDCLRSASVVDRRCGRVLRHVMAMGVIFVLVMLVMRLSGERHGTSHDRKRRHDA